MDLSCTIVLALYNGEKYIKEQLLSILNQTHKPDYVLIADDGSTDNSIEIVRNFISAHHLDSSWYVEKNDRNYGYADNFWYASNKAKTDVIFFCDQDDIWNSDKIEVMLSVLKKTDNIKVLGSGYTPFTDSGKPYVDKALTRVTETWELEKLNLSEKTIFIGCEGCTMAVRSDFLYSLRKFHYDKAPHDEFVWKAALCCDGCYVLHRSLMMRRFHENNVTHNKMHDANVRIRFLELLLKSHYAMLDYAYECRCDEEKISIIKKNIISVKLRIELIRDHKFSNFFSLLFQYRNNYHSRKAILTEIWIALKNT